MSAAQPTSAAAPTGAPAGIFNTSNAGPIAAGSMAVDPQPAVTAPSQVPAGRVVDEPVALATMTHDPVALVSQFRHKVAEQEAALAQLQKANEEFQARENARLAAEKAANEAAARAAEEQRKQKISDKTREMMALVEASIQQIKKNDPAISDAEVQKVIDDFKTDVQKAGFDENQIAEIGNKINNTVGIMVSASERIAQSREALQQREFSLAHDYLHNLQPRSSLTISGGVQDQMRAAAAPPVVPSVAAPVQQQASSTTATDMQTDSGTVLASKLAHTGIFSNLGKRSSSTADEVIKRAVTEPGTRGPVAASAPQIVDPVDINAPNWAAQVIERYTRK